MSGILYVVATPIGNLSDLSSRGAETLKQVAIIAAEDTRRTERLLSHIGGTHARLLSLHSHNESLMTKKVLAKLNYGEDVALVSDAGTPLVSDPGYPLVRAAWKEEIKVVPIPGPSAITALLSVSPIPLHRFSFEGFLPSKSESRIKRLSALANESSATLFFEAPHRIAQALKDLESIVAADRQILVGRELTKIHETIYSGSIAQVRAQLETEDAHRGEFVLLLEGSKEAEFDTETVRLLELLAKELPKTQAAKLTARFSGASRRDLYALLDEA